MQSERRVLLSIMPLTMLARKSPLATASEQLRLLDDTTPPFAVPMEHAGLFPLMATGITVFQINVGKLCNQINTFCR